MGHRYYTVTKEIEQWYKFPLPFPVGNIVETRKWNKRLLEAFDWCYANTGSWCEGSPDHDIANHSFYFKNEQDAVLFKLWY